MKKLRLKAFELKGFEILTREQLRNEVGGDAPLPSSSSSFSGGCGHNISCSGLEPLDICGSKGTCGCLAVPGGGNMLYCRSSWPS